MLVVLSITLECGVASNQGSDMCQVGGHHPSRAVLDPGSVSVAVLVVLTVGMAQWQQILCLPTHLEKFN